MRDLGKRRAGLAAARALAQALLISAASVLAGCSESLIPASAFELELPSRASLYKPVPPERPTRALPAADTLANDPAFQTLPNARNIVRELKANIHRGMIDAAQGDYIQLHQLLSSNLAPMDYVRLQPSIETLKADVATKEPDPQTAKEKPGAEFERILLVCQDVLSIYEKRADNLRFWRIGIAVVGAAAGGIGVTTLNAAGNFRVFSSALGAVSGLGNVAQEALTNEGLTASAAIEIRKNIVDKVTLAQTRYEWGCSSEHKIENEYNAWLECKESAIAEMSAACRTYAIVDHSLSAAPKKQDQQPAGK